MQDESCDDHEGDEDVERKGGGIVYGGGGACDNYVLSVALCKLRSQVNEYDPHCCTGDVRYCLRLVKNSNTHTKR